MPTPEGGGVVIFVDYKGAFELDNSNQNTAEFELSAGQQALWAIYQMSPESSAYNLAQAMRLEMSINVDALRNAFQQLVNRHSALRTTFSIGASGEPVQVIHQQREAWFHYEDASKWTDTELKSYLAAEGHRPFNLEKENSLRVFLLKQTENQYTMMLVMHHIIMDFWSYTTMIDELGILYHAELGSEVSGAELSESPQQFEEFVQDQNEMLNSAKGEKHWAFWQSKLEGDLPLLNLPTDSVRPRIQTYRGSSTEGLLDVELTRRLQQLSQEQGVTLYVLLLAAYQLFLHRYTNDDDIIVGTPMSARSRNKFATMVGYCVNSVALRQSVDSKLSFVDFLGQVKQTVFSTLRHKDYPFSTMVERLQLERDLSRSPVFQTMFAYEQAARPELQNLTATVLGIDGIDINVNGLTGKSVYVEERLSQFDLTVMMGLMQERMAITFKYNTDLFKAEQVERMFAHWKNLLQAIVDKPEQLLSEITVLPAAEQEQQVFGWNSKTLGYDEEKCVQQLFEEQAASTPDHIALAYEGQQLSYQQLNQRANQLAHYLRSKGVSADSLVGICMDRSLDMMVAVLAVLKAGGAYVAIESAFPKARKNTLLQNANVGLLLTQQELLADFLDQNLELFCLDSDWNKLDGQSPENPAPASAADNLAYVIFTSGSTGQPKGVMIEHRQLLNYVHSVMAEVEFPEQAHYALMSTLAADLGNTMIFPALCFGGCLHIIAENRLSDPQGMATYLQENTVDCVKIVPSHLASLLESKVFEQNFQYQRLILGGEVLTPELVERLLSICPSGKIFNHYGPTETTIGTAVYPINEDSLDHQARSVPIGYPLANTQLYILDENLKPVPVGVTGELYISGRGVTRGYLGQPEMTAEKYLDNPFVQSQKMYKSGDMARYHADGRIEFLGRSDNQVKIRGYRIEPGDIESCLTQHIDIAQAAVIAEHDQGDSQPYAGKLIAYLVSSATETPSVTEIRNHVKDRLPEYMIPTGFMFLDAMPLTANGKINRQALPQYDAARADFESAFEAPRNSVEEVLADMWAQMLNVDRVGVHDNFFEMGGHSLLAVQSMAQLQDIFQVEEPLIALFFETPTIAGVVAALLESSSSSDIEEIAETLKLVSSMSDDDVEAMLAGSDEESQQATAAV